MFAVKKWLFRQLYKMPHVLVTFEVLWLRQGILITHERWGNLTGINIKLGATHNKKVIFQMGWTFIIFCYQEFSLQKYFAHVSDPDPIAAATRSVACVQQCYWLNVCVCVCVCDLQPPVHPLIMQKFHGIRKNWWMLKSYLVLFMYCIYKIIIIIIICISWSRLILYCACCYVNDIFSIYIDRKVKILFNIYSPSVRSLQIWKRSQ